MIGTVLKISLLRLWNNKQEIVLIFIVPIIFFSIFAMIFTRGIGGTDATVKVAIVDEDQSQLSKEVIKELQTHETLEVIADFVRGDHDSAESLCRQIMRQHDVELVICFPLGLSESKSSDAPLAVRLLAEGTNPIAKQVASTLLTQALATTMSRLEQVASVRSVYATAPIGTEAESQSSISASTPRGLEIELQDAFADDKQVPKIAMYAAGIAVMFLLFSASGAGGSLLEEQEAGTLDRLLSSHLSVTQLLLGKWLYILLLGCVQITVMFIFAQLVFGVELTGHLPGFAVMTFSTAAATASLALCLAVFCRTRAQLNGVSVVLILSMSALGGSMVPRYLMSESMQRFGRITFNAWALDGYQNVFWYDAPLSALRTEVIVLLAMAAYLLTVARVFADRWETR
jgi:ABC-2 type transport system permease protein